MKRLFFILFVCTFVFPIIGMDAAENIDAIPAPATPGGAVIPKVSAATLHLNAPAISNLLVRSIEQINNVHRIFSGNYKKEDQPKIMVKAIQDLLEEGLLKNIFVPYFAAPRSKHFTPDCKKSLGTHLDDIDGNSPKTFLKKGRADFMKSVDDDAFYTFDTHEQNTFFIQKMLLDPEYGFGLYRSCNNTLFLGLEYGEYNVMKLLGGNNPETHSGVVELHHVYQNPEVVTIVPYGEHKGNTLRYHKSKKDSRIDRTTCASEFYYLKKLLGLLQVAKMCTRVLRDCDGLSEDVLTNMAYVENYTGNLGLIANPRAALKQNKKYTIEEAFLTHQALAGHDHDRDEDSTDSQFSGDERSASTEGHTSSSDLDDSQALINGTTSSSMEVLTPSSGDKKRKRGIFTQATGKENDNTDSESEDEFTNMFLRENPLKSHNSSEGSNTEEQGIPTI